MVLPAKIYYNKDGSRRPPFAKKLGPPPQAEKSPKKADETVTLHEKKIKPKKPVRVPKKNISTIGETMERILSVLESIDSNLESLKGKA